MDTHFRLLRHDLVAPLVEAASALRAAPLGDAGAAGAALPLRGGRLLAPSPGQQGRTNEAAPLHAFHNVVGRRMFSASMGQERGTRAGLSYIIEFDQPARGGGGGGGRGAGKHARAPAASPPTAEQVTEFWAASRRLQKGALVCVAIPTPSGQHCLEFATVCDRGIENALLRHSPSRARLGIVPCGPLHNKALLRLCEEQDAAGAGDQHQEVVLLEAAESYFSYAPVLRALQTMEGLPFQDHLLWGASGADGTQPPPPPVQPPAFVTQNNSYDLRLLASPGADAARIGELASVSPADAAAFPLAALAAATTLDARQAEALAVALTSEIALIQCVRRLPGCMFLACHLTRRL